MQGFCDGSSKPFGITHALECKRGGLVGAQHNDSRDLNMDLIHLTGLTQIVKELVLKEPGLDGLGGLRVDWGFEDFGSFRGRRCLISTKMRKRSSIMWLLN